MKVNLEIESVDITGEKINTKNFAIMDIREFDERKRELNKRITDIREQQNENEQLQRELAIFEEESHWQNKRIKEVNDDLIQNYSGDRKLQNLLAEKEVLLMQKVTTEEKFFEESREIIAAYRKQLEELKEECESEFQSIERMEGESVE